jgi:hypothetical protein
VSVGKTLMLSRQELININARVAPNRILYRRKKDHIAPYLGLLSGVVTMIYV